MDNHVYVLCTDNAHVDKWKHFTHWEENIAQKLFETVLSSLFVKARCRHTEFNLCFFTKSQLPVKVEYCLLSTFVFVPCLNGI